MKTLVVALGGNALLQRGEALTAENQYRNIASAVPALARLAAFCRRRIVYSTTSFNSSSIFSSSSLSSP